MRFAAGQLPDQPGIHCAEQQVALLRLHSGTIDVIENPFDFGPREIRVNQKSRSLPKQVIQPLRLQLLTDVCGLA
ncbi:hypothetical protein D3C86_2098070 [compost metagenome]